REGYVNGYAFGEAAGRKAVAKQDGACQHCAGKGCVACDAREQEPVTCKECHLKDTVYDLLGDLKVANLKLSVRSKRTWVGLTDEDLPALAGDNGKVMELQQVRRFAKAIETKLKEKNT
ncbi:MAG: hypothetical protein EB003_12755, partial [Flavobacteriia bacterium]|nr:hypothetical protein [Flavobacteriia bacterium]